MHWLVYLIYVVICRAVDWVKTTPSCIRLVVKDIIHGNQAGFHGDPKGRADRNADNLTWSNRALLISLQLQDGQISSFQPNSLGFKSSLENNGNGIVKELYPDPTNDNRRGTSALP